MGLFGITEKRTQLYFREDARFIFRELEVKDGFLIEKQGGKPSKAWQLPYRALKFFPGYMKINRAQVILGHARDIILDPFNQIDVKDKPEVGRKIDKPWITKVAESQRYKRIRDFEKGMHIPRLITILGVLDFVILVAVLILIFT